MNTTFKFIEVWIRILLIGLAATPLVYTLVKYIMPMMDEWMGNLGPEGHLILLNLVLCIPGVILLSGLIYAKIKELEETKKEEVK